jgi:hypothetical protein
MKKNRSALNLNIAGYIHKPIDNDNIDFFSILYNYWNIIEYSSGKIKFIIWL